MSFAKPDGVKRSIGFSRLPCASMYWISKRADRWSWILNADVVSAWPAKVSTKRNVVWSCVIRHLEKSSYTKEQFRYSWNGIFQLVEIKFVKHLNKMFKEINLVTLPRTLLLPSRWWDIRPYHQEHCKKEHLEWESTQINRSRFPSIHIYWSSKMNITCIHRKLSFFSMIASYTIASKIPWGHPGPSVDRIRHLQSPETTSWL